ncbi:hypothetical protein [Glutamicibacter uratoxydans]|uniref:hypothetical protein n=1 Tax=Glutamicibacter uratoxydans TaxID=43667 RepID=UPI0011440677|nr:hypothetical protein [Glutamicibacter uratoxydans]
MRIEVEGYRIILASCSVNLERDFNSVDLIIGSSSLNDLPTSDVCADCRLIEQVVIGPSTGFLYLIGNDQFILAGWQGHLNPLMNDTAFVQADLFVAVVEFCLIGLLHEGIDAAQIFIGIALTGNACNWCIRFDLGD